ncbi:agmatine coumaroyltransferase-2-like isoform X1 [Salvia miltiorrhiza]|uniref:agmatine coumaroyltransferase-2-like isoform X1 n=1 Tax=Salvia miltiorrhiza TaxID=226208 RepID=UPI0025AC84B6|nr:agmatine coumaroyltransferase-2-like isoform X1 [Salvia miltiorrhiza]
MASTTLSSPNKFRKAIMKLKIASSKLIKPLYVGNPPPTLTDCIPLSVFDKVTYDQHVAVVYAYRPPTPPNATIEQGLRRALAAYRGWAGRLGKDANGDPIILLNDEGVRFVEASVDRNLDQSVTFSPSTSLLSMHPALEGVVELVQVQLTRFSCGSMVVGFTAHHLVADGHATSNFLVAWGLASRGHEITSLPFNDRTIFSPRNPPRFDFQHRGAEYISRNFKKVYPLIDHDVDDIVAHKVHFTSEFLSRVKARASSMNGSRKPFSTFESLLAHLWRTITKARGLNGSETTQLRISVDGRARLNPRVPNEYFGNLVLWAFAKAKVDDLLRAPLPYAAKLLHEAVVNVNDDYFKSFIDFANHKVEEEDLVPNADTEESILWPNLEVHSWLRFPFYDLDLGSGSPYIFLPSFSPTEGMIFLLPSFAGDGSIDVFVPLFQENYTIFKEICFSLE